MEITQEGVEKLNVGEHPGARLCKGLLLDAIEAGDKLEARVEQQEQRIKELEPQLPKWISVKDRKPPEGQHVLVVRNHRLRSLYPIDVVCWSECYITHDIVTHWMPLPQQPKSEGLNEES